MISNIQILDEFQPDNKRRAPVPRIDDLSAELDQFQFRRRKSRSIPSRSFPSRLQTYVKYLPGNNSCPDCPLREALTADKGRSSVGHKNLTWTNVTFGTLICEECAQLHKQVNIKGLILLSLKEERWTLPRVLAIVEGGNFNMLKVLDRPDHHLSKQDTSSRKLFGSKRNVFAQSPNFADTGEICELSRSSKSLFPKKKRNFSKLQMSSLKSRYVSVNAELYSYHLSKRIMKLCLQFGIERKSSKDKKSTVGEKPKEQNVNPTSSRNMGLLKVPLVTGVNDFSDISEESQNNFDNCISDADQIDSQSSSRSKIEIKSHKNTVDQDNNDLCVSIDVISSSQKNSDFDTLNSTQDQSKLGDTSTAFHDSFPRKAKSLTHLEDTTGALQVVQKGVEINAIKSEIDPVRIYPSASFRTKNKEIRTHLKRRSYSDHFVMMNKREYRSSNVALVEDMCQDLDRLLK